MRGRALEIESGGRIGRAPSGANGFGDDPLLVLEDGRTSAGLARAEKYARSLCGNARRALVERLPRRAE